MLKISVLLILIFPNILFAGYEETTWGMDSSDVLKKYSDGYLEKNQNGEYSYGVVRPIAGFNTGFLYFKFNSEKKLNGVTIFFPLQGSLVDLKSGDFMPMEVASCNASYERLFLALQKKYGLPKVNNKDSKMWAVNGVDFIMLYRIQDEVKKTCTPSIRYEPITKNTDEAKGL